MTAKRRRGSKAGGKNIKVKTTKKTSMDEIIDKDNDNKVLSTNKNKQDKKQQLLEKFEKQEEIGSSSSSEEEEEEESVPIKKKKSTNEKQPKDDESSSSSSSDEDSSDSDENDGSDNDEKKKKKKKYPTVESSSSNDDDDDNDEKGEFFTDENAAWLKPKKQNELLESSSSSSSNEEEEEKDLLEVERQSRLVDAEMEQEEMEAREELQRTIAKHTSVFHLPTAEELEQEENRVVPPSEIRARIEAILEVLADFKTRREPHRSRTEYVDQLGSDLSELYGYLPELMDHFLTMLGPSECYEFVQASDKTRPLVVRTNTLKTRRKDLAAALMKRGVTLDPLATWSKVGLLISASNVPIGATPEYLAGHYMLQSAASMCPVLALSPRPRQRVLDVSAAPGGKTSYMAQLMQNTGSILANDWKPSRQKATVANLHRLGVRNVITACHDGRKLGSMFRNAFDRVLLDAPCSGLGVISRDPSVKVQRTMEDVKRTAHLQKELLLSAVDTLKKGGGATLVYSTCSVSVLENEEVVNYALTKRDIKIVDAGLEFGKPGFTRYQNKRFHPSVALTRRFYPHVHNMDGFFVAKIQKLSDRRPQDTLEQQQEEGVEKEAAVQELTKKRQATTKEEPEPKHKKTKKETLSVPPKVQKKKKKRKQNAKTLKPRRQKALGM